jgi:hypothetical protein
MTSQLAQHQQRQQEDDRQREAENENDALPGPARAFSAG